MWGSIGKMAGWGLGVVLAGLPFLFYNSHFSPYEVPKTWLLTGCAVVSLVLAIGRHESLGVKLDRKLVWSVAILWGWLFAVSLTTGEFWSSWWGNPYRADGLLTLLAMITLGLTFPVSDKWLRLVAISNLILTTWVLVVGEREMGLTLGHANMLAGYLAVTLPTFFLWGKDKRWLGLLSLLAIWQTGSWGGLLVGVVAVIAPWLRKMPKLVFAIVLVVLVAVGWGYQVEYQRKAIPGYIVAESRERILMKAVLAIKEKPILGWGWSQFSRAFTQIDYPEHFLVDAYVDRTHASVLEYGVAGGILAMVIYGWITINAVGKLWMRPSIAGRTL